MTTDKRRAELVLTSIVNKIVIQGTPQITVTRMLLAYRESYQPAFASTQIERDAGDMHQVSTVSIYGK